mgnify:FL=1
MRRSRIRNLSGFLRETFGSGVHKVGLWGGFSCPNRDGTLSSEGCSFCNPSSSRPASFAPGMDICTQLKKGCEFVYGRFGVTRFLPYFQDYTVTYGDPEKLLQTCSGVLEYPGVVGISLCTRPDCLGERVLDALEELAERTLLWVEVGVQTFDDALLRDMNRCHTAEDSLRAFESLHERKILSAAHMILGYPGSTTGTAVEDAEKLRGTGTAGVKLQNFHVVRGTEMAERFRRGEFSELTLGSYVGTAVRFIEHTDPGAVILRMTGHAPADMTVAPGWSVRKGLALEAIWKEMESRDTWQGKGLGAKEDFLGSPPIAAGYLKPPETIAGTTPPE